MGNLVGKQQTSPLDKSFCEDDDGAEFSTPTAEGDPRSPSLDIDRTPLQKTLTGPSFKVTKNVNLTKECFDKYDEALTNPAIRAAMNEFDPRSPTIDFERTPLAFLIKDPEWVANHNKMNTSTLLDVSVESNNLKELEPKNLCDDLANLTTRSEYDVSIQESNVEESTESVDIAEKKPSISEEQSDKQSVGLLETNFDYLETDIDIVRREIYKEFNKNAKCVLSKVEKVEIKIEEKVVQEEVKETIIAENIAFKDLSDADPRSPSEGINRTPLLVPESKDTGTKKTKSCRKSNSRVKDVLKNNAKLQQNLLYYDRDNDIKMNAKESLLIYEDKIENVSPAVVSKVVPNNIESSRTPLACMMNIDKSLAGSAQNTPLDSAGKLLQLKSRIPVRVSKISPSQFMDNSEVKLIKSRRIISGDTENTPPQPRKACWDVESSVVL